MLTIYCLVFVSFSLPPYAETSGYSAMNFVKSSCDFAKLSLDMQSTIKDVLRTKRKQSALLMHFFCGHHFGTFLYDNIHRNNYF
jgi:hypothetical protein